MLPQRRRGQRAKSPLPLRRCPLKYHETKHAMVVGVEENMQDMLKKMDLKKDEVILDYGCANGSVCLEYLAPLAEKMNWKIYSVDSSQAMIEDAKKTNAHPNVTYIQGHLSDEDFELKDKKFDRIFCVHHLQFLEDDFKEEIKNLYQLLAPGGIMLVLVAYHYIYRDILVDLAKHEEEWGDVCKDYLSTIDSVHDCIQNPDGWKAHFEEKGMIVDSILVQQMSYTYQNWAGWADLWFAHNSFAHGLPEKQKNYIRSRYIHHLETDPKNKGKECRLEYPKLSIVIRK